jgi:hypothetical protein
MTREPMQDLPRNARFIHDRREYVITTPASEHPRGWVFVIPVHGGESRFFNFGCPVDVEVVAR